MKGSTFVPTTPEENEAETVERIVATVRAGDRFAELRDEFVARVQVNPKQAIEWHADHLMQAQYEFEFLGPFVRAVRAKRTLQKLDEHLTELTERTHEYLMLWSVPSSTSRMANAIEANELKALQEVAKTCERLRKLLTEETS